MAEAQPPQDLPAPRGTESHQMPDFPHEHITQFFAYGHLPPHLQDVSKPFCDLHTWIIRNLPRNPERTVALRKLLEAKDAAVRAYLANPDPRR